MMTEENLDRLFETARNARVDTSQEEVTRWLATAAVTAVSAGAAATGFKLLLTKKALIMTIGTIGVASIAVVTAVVFPATEEQPNATPQNVITYTGSDETDTPAETTFYAENVLLEEALANDENPGQDNASGILPLESCMPYTTQHFVLPETPVYHAAPAVGVNYVPLLNTYRHDTLIPGKSQVLDVEPFSKLHIDGVFDVIITQGSEEKVVVVSEQADIVQAQNEGETLVLTSADSRSNARCKDVVNTVVRITVKNLDLLEVFGVGNVTVEGLTQPELTVQFDGVGDLVMDVICEDFLLIATGVGNVYMSGEANQANVEYDGVGDVRAYEFKVHNMHATNSGVGNMYIYADQTLVLDSDGIGDIRYQGNPNLKELHFTGVGTLQSESGTDGNNQAPERGRK